VVADGAPFCANCRAPQIRFVVPEPIETILPENTSFGDEAAPPPTKLAWPKALYAGFLGGIFSALAIIVFGSLGGLGALTLAGLGFLGGGVLAVHAYRRRAPGSELSLGSGAILGAISGIVGFLPFSLLLVLDFATHGSGKLQHAIVEQLNQMAQNADPQLSQQFKQAIEVFKTPEGFATMMILTCLLLGLIFVFFSILGGAIGSSMTRRKSS